MVKPFEQCYTICAYIRKKNRMKMVPLVYAFMTHMTKEDYKDVLEKIVELLGNERPAIQQFVADFEKAVWAAMHAVFPGITIHGCSFHLNQAFFKNMGQISDLVPAYRRDSSTHNLCRRLMCLYLLPRELITISFYALREEAISTLVEPYSGMVIKFCNYIERVWIKNSEWPPAVWTSFMQFVRTNNAQEGWHNKLKGNLNFNY